MPTDKEVIYVFDAKALVSVVEDRGVKYHAIAQQLNISDSSLRNKIKGDTEFTLTQIAELCRFLRLSDIERNRIFFA